MTRERCVRTVKDRATFDGGERRCERCGAAHLSGSVHHRLKRSHLPKARYWEVSNCVWLCGDGVSGCHGWVESHPNLAEVEGFHVRPWHNPAEVPVKLWYTDSPVCLDDTGGYGPCCGVDNE